MEPKKNHHTVETFVEAGENNVESILQEKKPLPKNNLSKIEKAALDHFTKREDIAIIKAGKGGATVIMNVEEYISKANQQIKEYNFYKKLNEEPTRKHNDIVNNIIESLKKQELLSTSTAEKLTTNEVTTQ